MINIENIKNNVIELKKSLPSLNIDSIFLEQEGKVDKVFYNDESLHELRSCSKLLVAMAVGIAIDKGMFSLDTLIYPSKNSLNKSSVTFSSDIFSIILILSNKSCLSIGSSLRPI